MNHDKKKYILVLLVVDYNDQSNDIIFIKLDLFVFEKIQHTTLNYICICVSRLLCKNAKLIIRVMINEIF